MSVAYSNNLLNTIDQWNQTKNPVTHQKQGLFKRVIETRVATLVGVTFLDLANIATGTVGTALNVVALVPKFFTTSARLLSGSDCCDSKLPGLFNLFSRVTRVVALALGTLTSVVFGALSPSFVFKVHVGLGLAERNVVVLKDISVKPPVVAPVPLEPPAPSAPVAPVKDPVEVKTTGSLPKVDEVEESESDSDTDSTEEEDVVPSNTPVVTTAPSAPVLAAAKPVSTTLVVKPRTSKCASAASKVSDIASNTMKATVFGTVYCAELTKLAVTSLASTVKNTAIALTKKENLPSAKTAVGVTTVGAAGYVYFYSPESAVAVYNFGVSQLSSASKFFV